MRTAGSVAKRAFHGTVCCFRQYAKLGQHHFLPLSDSTRYQLLGFYELKPNHWREILA